MDVRVGLWRRLSTEELMLLNCGVGKDSWESLGLQGDQTSPFWRRSALRFLWKEWCWSWNSSTLATSCKELTHWKRLWCWRDWGQEEKGTTEDEMAGWHHWLDGRESEWTLGVVDRQGGCCDSWGRKELDTTERLNWTELNCTRNSTYSANSLTCSVERSLFLYKCMNHRYSSVWANRTISLNFLLSPTSLLHCPYACELLGLGLPSQFITPKGRLLLHQPNHVHI